MPSFLDNIAVGLAEGDAAKIANGWDAAMAAGHSALTEATRDATAADAARAKIAQHGRRVAQDNRTPMQILKQNINTYQSKLNQRQAPYYFLGMLAKILGLGRFFKVHTRDSKEEAAFYLGHLVNHHLHRSNPEHKITDTVEVVGERLSALESGQLGKLFAEYKRLTLGHFELYQGLADARTRAIDLLLAAPQKAQSKIPALEAALQTLALAASADPLNMDAVNAANETAIQCAKAVNKILEEAANYQSVVRASQASSTPLNSTLGNADAQFKTIKQTMDALLARKRESLILARNRNSTAAQVVAGASAAAAGVSAAAQRAVNGISAVGGQIAVFFGGHAATPTPGASSSVALAPAALAPAAPSPAAAPTPRRGLFSRIFGGRRAAATPVAVVATPPLPTISGASLPQTLTAVSTSAATLAVSAMRLPALAAGLANSAAGSADSERVTGPASGSTSGPTRRIRRVPRPATPSAGVVATPAKASDDSDSDVEASRGPKA